MKWLIVALLLIPIRIARPQVKSGTVFYVDVTKDEVTIAADSRTTISDGRQNDMECKISAFGNQFVFVMSGLVSAEGIDGWSGHSIAREVWEVKSKTENRP